MSKEHWQNIYSTKQDDQVSWTQDHPNTPINYLSELNLAKDTKIIDVGGGASKFVDLLLQEGYTDITVLDISESALYRSQDRLGDNASKVKWIVADILDFDPSDKYQFWYDRALFHFLTSKEDRNIYVELVSNKISKGGHFLLGTFSDNGPIRCSGLEICRYSDEDLKAIFKSAFKPRKCFAEIHTTPFGTTQDFQYCGFTKEH